MEYPGRTIKEGERDARIVKAVQAQLNARNCGPLGGSGVFGSKTTSAVRLFQAQHVDALGNTLKRDGRVGPLTWAALFGHGTVPILETPTSEYLVAVIDRAASQVGVREDPRNSNSGPRVNEYLKRVGVPLGLPAAQKPWCCAFVYWCFDEVARERQRRNPMPKTAGCLSHWNLAQARGAARIGGARAAANPSLVEPGMVFVIDAGGGRGHTGFVERVDGGVIHTIEGNTDASQTREGGGVYQLRRKIADINKGFVDYSDAIGPGVARPIAPPVRGQITWRS